MSGTNYSFYNALNAFPPAIVHFAPAPPSLASDFVYLLKVSAAQLVEPDFAKDLLDRLRELRRLYATPALPGSKVPNNKAYEDAKAFILSLPLNRILQPTIQVASDGEVNFEWSHGTARIDLGFYGDGTFSFFGMKEGGFEIAEDSVPVAKGAPPRLLDLASST